MSFPNWVDVSLAVPAEGQRAIVAVAFGPEPAAGAWDIRILERGDGVWLGLRQTCGRAHVTHWMPLPEDPAAALDP